VQAFGPLVDKLAGHVGRVFAKDHFAAIVSLHEADTFSAAKIDGRPNLHGKRSSPEANASTEGETVNMA
jgi:hypothetical protein